MNVSMTPELEAYIHKSVKSGLYQSASEFMREAVRLMHHREKMRKKKLRELDEKIQIGLDQFERGEFLTETEFKKDMANFRKKILSKRG